MLVYVDQVLLSSKQTTAEDPMKITQNRVLVMLVRADGQMEGRRHQAVLTTGVKHREPVELARLGAPVQ